MSLALIVLAGAAMRFSHADWDGGNQLHPDERAILFIASQMHAPDHLTDWLRPDLSPLNPFRSPGGGSQPYPYGHFPLYASLIASRLLALPCVSDRPVCSPLVLGTFSHRLLNASYEVPYTHLTYVGRALSAMFDSLTLAATFLLARDLFGQRAGLLAGAFVALAILHIQNAHFGTVDTALGLFVTLALWLLVRYTKTRDRRDSILAGVCIGLAVGCKATAILLIGPLLAAHWAFDPAHRQLPRLRVVSVFWGTALAAALTFAVTNPYAVLDPIPFVRFVVTQAQVTSGSVDWPFTRQYLGTPPIVYPVAQQARWTLGVPLTVALYAGLIWGTIQVIRERARPLAVPVVWAWLLLLTVGTQLVKFPRYLLPATPALASLGAGLLAETRWWRSRTIVQIGLVAIIILPTGLYALAFIQMYNLPHPWVAASEWIHRTLPPGTMILVERWDDPLPLDLSVDGTGYLREATYRSVMIDPFAEPDDPAKIAAVAEAAADADYIILSSNRLYGVIPRLARRYPLTGAYYRALFAGDLGYTLDRTFSRYPHLHLFGVALADDPLAWPHLPDPRPPAPYLAIHPGPADESFTVYDHPLVWVFRNEAHLSAARIRQILLDTARQ